MDLARSVVTLSTKPQRGTAVRFVLSLAVRAALVSAALVYAADVVPARASEAVAQELADCQDEQKPAAERIDVCTALIGLAGIDDALKAEALLNRGMAHQDADDLASAIGDYARAIALNPAYPALYMQRANAYAETNDVSLALKDMMRAIELQPDNADYLATRGKLYAENGDFVLAEADYRKALELEAFHEEALAGLKERKK